MATAEESLIAVRLKRRSVVLIGMHGAGKSFIGRRLAQRLGLPFVDGDSEVEAAAGMTIPELFETGGEAAFRTGEARVIARLLDGGPQVLATGGGAFQNEETRALIRAKGISIWLKADSEVLMKRIKRRSDRPMLKTADPAATLQKLMADHHRFYVEADIVTDSGIESADQVVSSIVASLSDYFQTDVHPDVNEFRANEFLRARNEFSVPITIIPEQEEKRAISFQVTHGGELDLIPDSDPNFHDAETTALYSRIRHQLREITEQIPTQERSQIDSALQEFLNEPEHWHQVQFKKLLWLSGNSLRVILAQHDLVKDQKEPHHLKLPGAVAEALRRPVQAWNIFLAGDSTLAGLEQSSFGPREQEAVIGSIQAAKPLLEQAAIKKGIATERASQALEATFKAAERGGGDINSKLVQSLAERTSKNFLGEILRRAYLLRDALANPTSDAASVIALELAKGSVKAVGAMAAAYAVSNSAVFFDFVAIHANAMKHYILASSQNHQLIEIVDAIKYEYEVLKSAVEPGDKVDQAK